MSRQASLLVNKGQFSSFAASSSFHCLASLSLVFDFLNSLISFPILCNSIRRIIAELCSLIIYSLLCLYRTWTEQLKWKCVSLENSWSCLQTLYVDNVQGHWKWDKNLYCHAPMTVIWKVYSLANKVRLLWEYLITIAAALIQMNLVQPSSSALWYGYVYIMLPVRNWPMYSFPCLEHATAN